MARVLRIIVLTLFLRSLAAQQTNGFVSVGASLTATANVKPWLSPSGDFAFGFQQVQEEDRFLLSIWYDKILDKTIVWYPQGGPTVPRGSKVELADARGLVLSDPQGREVWTSNSSSALAYGFMNDTGNFVIVRRTDSGKIWESFDFPADTMLPTQVMERGAVINSKISKANFSSGRFQLRLLDNGNLVLNTRDIPSGSAYEAYYISGTSDPSNSKNSGGQLIFDATGYMYIMRRNGRRFNLTPRGALPSGDYYHRATLDSDGVFTQYTHPKNPTGNTSWQVIWLVPENICVANVWTIGSGICGFNNVCNLVDDRPNCECPRGFSLLDPSDRNGDCKPDFTPTCEDVESNYGADLFELTGVDWPLSDYVHIVPTNQQNCKNSCLEDCFCAVAIYNRATSECWKKKLPLSNGKKDTSVDRKAFVKFRNGVVPPGRPPVFPAEKKDQRRLIMVGSALLGTSVFVTVVLIGVICVCFFVIYKKKPRNGYPSSNVVETNLPRFTYQELLEASNGFKDELGKGAFGKVYKGLIGSKTVAMKKLDRVVHDGEKEFKAEVNAIARTHHKNLVQLLGYCDDGEQRLLIYEFMSNGTLAGFLFADTKPSWKSRSHIALGVAKGLSYLHEECITQVIHCDIKPQNVLLDDHYNAKIADFGLAKLLMINQSRTSTGIRGTKGYVAPEWFRNAPVTVKVDVYSYGVLLLEIISCRKSLDFQSGNEDATILTDWAWDCYEEGRLHAFVENDMESLNDHKKLTTFVMVGLWCVQENPSLRPTMKAVTLMLEGVVEVPSPPCPSPFSVT